MPTSMEKPLNGAGLAIVNQIFNERLSELGGGSGGVDWETTPYLSMNYINNNDVFFSALMSTERRSSTIRYVRSTIIAYVKSDSYSGNAQILVTLPGDFPELTFPAASNDLPRITGTGAVGMEMTGTGSKVAFRINPAKSAVAGGLYVGCVTATVVG